MTLRRTALLALAVLAPLLVLVAPMPSASAAGRPIQPGVQMIIAGAQCTANFVYRQKGHPKRVYVGMAAHCAGKGSDSDTNGCTTPSYPLGTRVQFVTGANLLSGGTQVGTGRLAYSSWIAMHRAHTRAAGACGYNDLALVRVDRKYLSRVSPSVPGMGGPVRLARQFPAVGAPVYSLGSSSLRGSTQAKSGTVQSRSTWTMTVRTGSPGVPGDSGSGFLDRRGGAIGVLSTLDIFPNTGSNGVGSLYQEVRFARSHGMAGLRLATGRPFTPPSGGGGLLGLL
ncbi:trypsin-like peptidase domain-containing protein [Nocardioides terrisoli]|uniref:trypsin-like peptidase domain-containing protein n=1 Tax=Nocardioides terrisoli TaxID=3388267 RepID=UPI00287BC4BE|nr:trypsin-like peptidase domain-containing protein [Nocardioides marmorisolisilvae]